MLMRTLEDLSRGYQSHVFIAGEPGAGKSRLLEEFRVEARLRQVTVTTGRCVAGGQAPLAALEEALRPLVPLTSEETYNKFVEPLTFAFPSLARANASATKTGLGENLKNLSEWLGGLAKRSPVVILLEDMHWADFATVEYFDGLSRSLEHKRVLFLNTYRPNEIDPISRMCPLRRPRGGEGSSCLNAFQGENSRVGSFDARRSCHCRAASTADL